ncbi:uncharacterized protein LOC135387302 [Ornithodoros turicata]|uniref:uncharacterized protein LOC135387302 n=1 Tax=Ornithodoros turicata TaxID=34597 RepID=UPI00313882DB
MWPPQRNATKLRALIEEGRMLTENWTRQKCKPLGLFCTYEQARRRLPLAEVTSDLSTDQDLGRGKRKRVARTISSSEDEDSSLLPDPPTPPLYMTTLPKQKVSTPSSCSDVSQTPLKGYSRGTALNILGSDADCADEEDHTMTCRIIRGSAATASSSSSQRCSVTTVQDRFGTASDVGMSNVGLSNEQCRSDQRSPPVLVSRSGVHHRDKGQTNTLPGSADATAFQKRVLSLLHFIRYEVQDHSGLLTRILSKLDSYKGEEEEEKLFGEPTDSLSDFLEFDKELRVGKQKQVQVRTFLGKFGGRDTADQVARMLSRVLTDNLATEFSWCGARGKQAFKDLAFVDILCESVTSSSAKHKENATFRDVEEAVKSWLRHAKERMDRKTERAAKMSS